MNAEEARVVADRVASCRTTEALSLAETAYTNLQQAIQRSAASGEHSVSCPYAALVDERYKVLAREDPRLSNLVRDALLGYIEKDGFSIKDWGDRIQVSWEEKK